MKVQSMTSKKTGKAVPNQFIISQVGSGANGNFLKKKIFQSYDSVIAERITWSDYHVQVRLDDQYWDYSKTTSKYRNEFLGETTKETQAKIDSGEYTLENLN